MTSRIAEAYEALNSAGAGDDKALAGYQKDIAGRRGDVKPVEWVVGFDVAFSVTIPILIVRIPTTTAIWNLGTQVFRSWCSRHRRPRLRRAWPRAGHGRLVRVARRHTHDHAGRRAPRYRHRTPALEAPCAPTRYLVMPVAADRCVTALVFHGAAPTAPPERAVLPIGVSGSDRPSAWKSDECSVDQRGRLRCRGVCWARHGVSAALFRLTRGVRSCRGETVRCFAFPRGHMACGRTLFQAHKAWPCPYTNSCGFGDGPRPARIARHRLVQWADDSIEPVPPVNSIRSNSPAAAGPGLPPGRELEADGTRGCPVTVHRLAAGGGGASGVAPARIQQRQRLAWESGLAWRDLAADGGGGRGRCQCDAPKLAKLQSRGDPDIHQLM